MDYRNRPIIFKDKYTATFFGAGLLILLIAGAMAFFNLRGNTSVLLLRFDIFRGTEVFGNSSDVYATVFFGAVLWLINASLAQVLYFRERFLSYFFAIVSLIVALLIIVATGVIISIN